MHHIQRRVIRDQRLSISWQGHLARYFDNRDALRHLGNTLRWCAWRGISWKFSYRAHGSR